MRLLHSTCGERDVEGKGLLRSSAVDRWQLKNQADSSAADPPGEPTGKPAGDSFHSVPEKTHKISYIFCILKKPCAIICFLRNSGEIIEINSREQLLEPQGDNE